MLEVKSDGPVLYCTLNRPEVRNAFNDELIDLLTHTFKNIPAATRAVVLSGNGKSFCAGGDLEWMRKAASYSEEMNYHDALKLGGLFEAIANTRSVVISKVHGAAFGGGCGLVAASDVAIAAEDTLFAFSEVRLGLIPGTISPFVIPKIGAGNARALFATGEAFSAEKALRIGLIHEAGPTDKLDALVEQKLKAVLSAGPDAVWEAKKLALSGPLPLEECAQRLATARASAEGREGVAAFLERRKASYVVER
ncbi:MAG TPA: enoyl-CoA hydratase-related protein [Fimbriimonadaceae bacterium]|jgi:enoyl-CoA hydratase/carnithine racemase